ncbi:MAG: hypothetical protein WBC05_03835 [Sedimentisphaerales bacterium]
MKLSKRMGFNVALGLIVVIALSTVFLYSPPGKIFRFMLPGIRKERQKKVILLSETDHQALLEACRKLSREIEQGNLLAPHCYMIRYKPSPEITRFPQVILDVDPMFIDTWADGRIAVGMCGGFHHYGVMAYPENYEKPRDNFKYGDKKIIDGLWYYEDGYNPKYDKWIESLLKKGKRRREN